MNEQNSTTPPIAKPGNERDFLVRELERRIEILENLDDSTFGRFTVLDWVLCIICFVILPHIALWLFI